MHPRNILLLALCPLLPACDKPSASAPHAAIPAVPQLLAAAETPLPPAEPESPPPAAEDSSARLKEIRRKLQKANGGRAGGYLEQMNEALASGDTAAAGKALAAAIAQGTLTQTQIEEARGLIQAKESQQQALVAAARSKQEAEAAASAASAEMAENQRREIAGNDATVRPASAAGGAPPADRPGRAETELDRFRAHWKGKTADFTVKWDNGGGLLSGTKLEVRDPNSGKSFLVSYDTGIGEGIFDPSQKSAVGATVSIRFNGEGTPVSIKNPGTGRSLATNNGWKVTGYGW